MTTTIILIKKTREHDAHDGAAFPRERISSDCDRSDIYFFFKEEHNFWKNNLKGSRN